MSPRSLRTLETALVSAFVSLGVSAVVLLGMAPPSTAPVPVAQGDPLAPFLRTAIEADLAWTGAETMDDVAVYRAQALYEWYAEQSERRAVSSDVEWARERAANLEQLREDLATMRRLEAEARALEASER